MLDDVVAVAPTDPKGADLVPLWEADYRTYIEDRRQFADVLRTGVNEPFTETAVDGIPISEKLERFAADNEMPDLRAPPRHVQLSVLTLLAPAQRDEAPKNRRPSAGA